LLQLRFLPSRAHDDLIELGAGVLGMTNASENRA
jgi:hypothetical protein